MAFMQWQLEIGRFAKEQGDVENTEIMIDMDKHH